MSSLPFILGELSPSQLATLGYSLHDMVANCRIGENSCKLGSVTALLFAAKQSTREWLVLATLFSPMKLYKVVTATRSTTSFWPSRTQQIGRAKKWVFALLQPNFKSAACKNCQKRYIVSLWHLQ